MCIVFLALNTHPDYSLIVASNRDEFYDRPTAPISWWNTNPNILAGKDKSDVLGTNGTWMGLNMNGAFSTLTNIRAPSEKNPYLRTRGELTANFLKENLHPLDYISTIENKFNQYNGFNLLLGRLAAKVPAEIYWFSNRLIKKNKFLNEKIEPLRLLPGIYGISNASLDTPWPKLTSGLADFSLAIKRDKGDMDNSKHYFELLRNEKKYPIKDLPNTGVSREWEILLSSIFIRSESYGTRNSSLLKVKKNGEFQFTVQEYNSKECTGTATFNGVFK